MCVFLRRGHVSTFLIFPWSPQQSLHRGCIRLVLLQPSLNAHPGVGGESQREVESLLADNGKGLFLPEELAKGVEPLKRQT